LDLSSLSVAAAAGTTTVTTIELQQPIITLIATSTMTTNDDPYNELEQLDQAAWNAIDAFELRDQQQNNY
jgi:hypothetical protein